MLRDSLAGESTPVEVGRYRVGDRIGAGGCGVVYEGHDPQLDRAVAIKLVPIPEERDAALALREARAMAAVQHRHTIEVFDVGVVGRELFIVMELVRGGSLRDWLQTEPPNDAIVEALLQTARGLSAAHAAGVVHHDFKPDNVLRTASGRFVVTDFGLSTLLDVEAAPASAPALEAGSSGSDRTGVGGTFGYAAPERVAGDRGDARSDQYSWSVTLFEALTGQHPAQDPNATARSLAEAGPRDPHALRRLPRAVAKVLARGLAVEPQDRFASMAELIEELTPRRPRWRAPLAVAVTLATVVGIGFSRTKSEPEVDAVTVVDAVAKPEVDPEAEALVTARLTEAHRAAIAGDTSLARESLAQARDAANDGVSPALLARVERVSGEAAMVAGRLDEAVSALEASAGLATAADSPEEYLRTATLLLRIHGLMLREPETAKMWGNAALAYARRAYDPRAESDLQTTLSHVAGAQGRVMDAAKHAEHALALASAAYGERHLSLAPAMAGLAVACTQADDLECAATHAQACVELVETLDGPESIDLIEPLTVLANVAARDKRYEVALELHERVAKLVRRFRPDDRSLQMRIAGNQGQVLERMGRHRDAVEALRRAVEFAEPQGVMTGKLQGDLARALLHIDRRDEAEALVERALLNLAPLGPDHGWRTRPLMLRAQLAAERGETAIAREAYGELCPLYTKRGQTKAAAACEASLAALQ